MFTLPCVVQLHLRKPTRMYCMLVHLYHMISVCVSRCSSSPLHRNTQLVIKTITLLRLSPHSQTIRPEIKNLYTVRIQSPPSFSVNLSSTAVMRPCINKIHEAWIAISSLSRLVRKLLNWLDASLIGLTFAEAGSFYRKIKNTVNYFFLRFKHS